MWSLLIILTAITIVSSIVSPNLESSPQKKFETAQKFIRHYNSLKPIGVLVDDTQESRDDAKKFMANVLEMTPNAKFVPFTLQIFNSTGVSPPVKITADQTFDNLLAYSQDHGISHLDPTESNATAAFFAILNAANSLTQNSAIIVFTDRKIADEYLAAHTDFIRKKNIKVYAVWGGLYPTRSGEDRLLRNLCEYSGGLFLVNKEKNISDYYYRQYVCNKYPPANTSILLSENNLSGRTTLTFPIDVTITGIQIRIAPVITNGALSTPKGSSFNISNKNEVSAYSTGSFAVIEGGLQIIHLNLTTSATRDVGNWLLDLTNTHVPYNVTVFVHTDLTAHVYFIEKNTGLVNVSGSDRKVMKLGLSAGNTSISSISFVDKNGHHITTHNAKYTLVQDSLLTGNASDKQIDVEFLDTSETPVYALVQGKDNEGNEFSRLTYINSYNSKEIFPQPTLSIEVGAGSELFTTSGRLPVILFEVTNQQSTSVDVRFTCKDEKSILRFLRPYRQIIAPRETAIVRLTLIPKFGSYEDEITFTAWIGSESFTKKVIVDVGSQAPYDNEKPKLDYSFSSDCSKIIFSSCQDGTWTVKLTAQDTGSGLLQITSYPKGLYFPGGFTTGTRQEVVGYYSNSCCNPDLQVIAVDRLNNREVIDTNAYLSFWGPAQIAALVLGILLLILIILLVVYLIRKCIEKRENYDLPTYRGGRI